MSKTQCKSCKHNSYAFDDYMDLSISIPRKGIRITGYVTLEECLQNFSSTERMEACGYKCSACKKVDNFEKDITIYRFPRILVIHLKRFYNSYMRREKINTSVEIPMKLNMTSYGPYSKDPSLKGAANYTLYGISHHSGTLYGGHYIG